MTYSDFSGSATLYVNGVSAGTATLVSPSSLGVLFTTSYIGMSQVTNDMPAACRRGVLRVILRRWMSVMAACRIKPPAWT